MLEYLMGLTGIWPAFPASDVLGFSIILKILLRQYRKRNKSF
jgi:Na+-driven multidrug efflux pump